MDKATKDSQQTLNHFPPVVTVLGHVDHGKTTLLDAIRKTNIAQKEHGGITQSIGASYVEVNHEGVKRRITFIDTPGHEAFTKMRSRGVQAADMSLLIVSSVDGVMPQTKESIKILGKSHTPIIVVFTKSDIEEKNIEKVKQQILKEGVLLEGLGGDVPYIEVSARTGKNIKELLDLILLVFDLYLSTLEKESLPSFNKLFKGVVIESRLDQKSGPKATVVVKNGKVFLREEIVSEGITAKIKALISPEGIQEKEATVGDAVEILGFEKVPAVGGIVVKKGEEAISLATPLPTGKVGSLAKTSFFNDEEEGKLPIILSADSFGSLEAIIASLPEGISVVSQKTGEITPSDVLLAKSVKALVIGFRAKIKNEVITMAKTEKILLKNYSIIYELLDELKDAVEGKILMEQEQILGKAKILARFPFEKTEVMGVSVIEGRAAKGDKVRLLRGEETLGESTVTSLRQGKNQISKIESGQQGGVILSPFLDFNVGDVLIFHR